MNDPFLCVFSVAKNDENYDDDDDDDEDYDNDNEQIVNKKIDPIK